MLHLRKIFIFMIMLSIGHLSYAVGTAKPTQTPSADDYILVRAMKTHQKFSLSMLGLRLNSSEYETTLEQARIIAEKNDDYESYFNAAILHALQPPNPKKFGHLLEAERYAMYANAINFTKNNEERDMESEFLMGYIRELILFPEQNLRKLRNQSDEIKQEKKDVLFFLKTYERYGKKYPSNNLVRWDRMGVYYRALGQEKDAARCEQNARRYIYSENTNTIEQVQESLQHSFAA